MSAEYIECLRKHLNSNEAFLAAKQENLAKIECTIKYLKKVYENNRIFIENEILRENLEKRIDILEEWKILWNAAT